MHGFKTYVVIGTVAIACGSLVDGRGDPQGRGGRPNAERVSIQPGQECPAGMTEVRHLVCQAPEKPAPSIVDYRPKSTVIAPEHLVPKAKFPVVDIHNHTQITSQNIEQMVREMD